MYRWNMRAFTNAGVASDYSADMYFQTPAGTLSAPTPIAPGSTSSPGPVISNLTPTFSWNQVSGADYYRFSISVYPYGSSNIIYTSSNLNSTSYALPSGTLQNSKMYRWNMRAFTNAGVASDYSADMYFQTPAGTQQFQQPSPPLNLRVISISDKEVNLAWDPPLFNGGSPITYYKIYRGVSSGNPNLIKIIHSSLQEYKDTENIKNNITYYYSVKALNDVGESNFSIEISAVPQINEKERTATPILFLPKNNCIFTTDSVDFSWNYVNNADYYGLYITDSSNNFVYFNENINATHSYTKIEKLTVGGIYYWKVRAHSNNGWSEFSEERNFVFIGETYISKTPEKSNGAIVIPKEFFPKGNGEPIPIYVPPVVNSSNAIIKDNWLTVYEKIITEVDFDWKIFYVNFFKSLTSEPKNNIDAILAITSGLIESSVSTYSSVKIKITIQENPSVSGKFRAILQLGDTEKKTLMRKYAYNGRYFIVWDFPYSAGFADAEKGLDEYLTKRFGLEPSGGYLNYSYKVIIDPSHNTDEFIEYLSLSPDGRMTRTPKIYPLDTIQIIREIVLGQIPYYYQIVAEFSGDEFINFLEDSNFYPINDSIKLMKILAPFVLVP
jgi:hypothetical protein